MTVIIYLLRVCAQRQLEDLSVSMQSFSRLDCVILTQTPSEAVKDAGQSMRTAKVIELIQQRAELFFTAIHGPEED